MDKVRIERCRHGNESHVGRVGLVNPDEEPFTVTLPDGSLCWADRVTRIEDSNVNQHVANYIALRNMGLTLAEIQFIHYHTQGGILDN